MEDKNKPNSGSLFKSKFKTNDGTEEDRKRDLEREQESFDARKARGMVGSRSLFGKAGGSGYLS